MASAELGSVDSIRGILPFLERPLMMPPAPPNVSVIFLVPLCSCLLCTGCEILTLPVLGPACVQMHLPSS